MAKLRDLTAKAGRDPSAVTAGLSHFVQCGGAAEGHGGRRAQAVHRGAADFVGDIKALAEAGVTSFDSGMFAPTLAGTIDNMRRFKDEVMAKVK